ncbi:hypothetical protein M0R45_011142 [Rubus argutus]|uniref:Uncharacterized protein n=1 Tax=Rubus argutus TaxID=59490 RepID=A0AAW1Y965_RUBAR
MVEHWGDDGVGMLLSATGLVEASCVAGGRRHRSRLGMGFCEASELLSQFLGRAQGERRHGEACGRGSWALQRRHQGGLRTGDESPTSVCSSSRDVAWQRRRRERSGAELVNWAVSTVVVN